MDMALATSSQSAIDLGQRLETILRRGHLYQNNAASGNSNVHYGDRVYVTYNVTYNTSSSVGSTPAPTDQSLPEKTSDNSSSSKRKRASDEGESRERKTRENDCEAFENALTNLGEFSKIKEQLEKGENGRKIAAYLTSVLQTLRHVKYSRSATDDTSLRPDELLYQLKQTRCIKINAAFPQRQVAMLSRQDSNVVGAQVGHWRVSLNTIVMNTQHPYSSQACSVLHAQPLRNSGGFNIAALFSRVTDVDHIANAHPFILVYKGTRSLCRQVPLEHGVRVSTDWAEMKHLSHELSEMGPKGAKMTAAGHGALHFAATHSLRHIVEFLLAL